MSKYRVFSGPYLPVFNPNTVKYGSEKTSYLDTFHAVINRLKINVASVKYVSMHIMVELKQFHCTKNEVFH